MANVLDRAIVRLLPAIPKPIVRKVSNRYIAGATLEDACRVVSRLNEAGKMATIDVLGEHLDSPDQARALVHEYDTVFDAIERNGLDSNVSIKLTALGLTIDRDVCLENAEAVIKHAAASGNFVRIDMEESTWTTETLGIYRELRGRGYDNVGVVLQSRLRRTIRDIRALADLKPNVRLCKGIYLEPPLIAYQEYQEVRDNFVAALELLLKGGSYVGIATHDEWLLQQSLSRVEGLAREDYEFQMLLGVRELRGDKLVRDGHRLRIYTPFGKHWHAYSMRRLQENPKIAGYILSDLLGANGLASRS
ncbi:MAG: proline dehydrogenase family protein [Actinobacteria bacterium]|nr:proline dehydrogenase family protein [Actinomycetota bacterium]